MAVALISPLGPVQSATLTEHVDIECRQPEPLSLQCDYRILNGADIVSVAAEHSGIVVDGIVSADNIGSPKRTATLFLVDTSDPARNDVVARNGEHIRRIVDYGAPFHVYGLASFDSKLEMLCDVGCSAEEVASATQHLAAIGKTTELYRNVLDAIKILRAYDAQGRQIILMSDGLAEDLAYHHQDVIKAARNGRVVISSMGYPRSVPQSVALQTLRRLSEETGGLFVQANHIDYAVPEGFFERVMSTVDGSGRVEFELHELQRQDVAGNVEISLAFQTTEQSFLLLVPIVVPRAAVEPGIVENVIDEPASTPPPVVAPAVPVQPNEGATSWFWYGLPAVVFSAILAGAIGYAVLTRRRPEHEDLNVTRQSIPHAFLVLADHDGVRYKIDHTPWRIGRSRNNDLTLDHTSVSRVHAEIRRDALGQFTIQDLESLNGVFVNADAIDMCHLGEKDRVEIGDVSFLFTMHDEDYAKQDATVLIHTRNPI